MHTYVEKQVNDSACQNNWYTQVRELSNAPIYFPIQNTGSFPKDDDPRAKFEEPHIRLRSARAVHYKKDF
jgi:hypothetical protein